MVLLEALVWLSIPGMALLRMTVRREVEIAVVELEPVFAENDENRDENPTKTKRSKASQNYVNRLENEFPAIAKRVNAGEISLYRGTIEAGLRKARPAKSGRRLRITSPERPAGRQGFAKKLDASGKLRYLMEG